MTRQRFGGTCLLLALLIGPGCGPRPQTTHEFIEQLHEDGNFEASLPHLQRLLRASPDDSHASYLLGVALARTGQPGPAVWPLLRAAEKEAHAPAAGRLLAQLLLESRNPEAAVDAASAALRGAPDDTDLLRIRGHAFLAASEPEAALTDGDALLEIRPGDLEALALRASALVALERLEEAEVAFERLAELGEASGDPRQAMRGCLARASFRIRIDGGSEPARAAAAARVLEASGLDWTLAENEPGLTALAEFHAEAGEVDSALAAIDGALARSPRISLHDLRGRILLSAGREQEARDAFRAARALDPKSPGPRVGLALLALREGRLREASLHVDRALEAEQLDPAARYAASRILRLLGRRDEVRAQLEAVIREDPGHASACTDLARLLAEQETDLDRALALARRAERIEPGAEADAAVAYVESRRRQRTN